MTTRLMVPWDVTRKWNPGENPSLKKNRECCEMWLDIRMYDETHSMYNSNAHVMFASYSCSSVPF
jgi:hypothetical protein